MVHATQGFGWRRSSPRLPGFAALGRILASSVHPSTDGHRAIASACPVRAKSGSRVVRQGYEVSTSSSALASFRSTVSKPSVNEPKTGARSSRAAVRLPCSRPNSDMGHQRTCRPRNPTSVLPLRSDIADRAGRVGFVPTTEFIPSDIAGEPAVPRPTPPCGRMRKLRTRFKHRSQVIAGV
jgi:hypothetical protein